MEENLPEAIKYFKIAKETNGWGARQWLEFIEDTERDEERKEDGEPGNASEMPGKGAKVGRKQYFLNGDLVMSPEWFVLMKLSETDDWGFTNMEAYKNDRGGYENDVFAIRAYYWGDDVEECARPNFRYKPTGLEIRWYKHPFRSGQMSQKLDETEIRKIWRKCIESVIGNIRELRR